MTDKQTPELSVDDFDGNKPDNSQQQPSVLANLAFNIIIPTVIMTKFSDGDTLGPVYGMLAALAFPVVYGAHDYMKRHKSNFFSVIGVVSVILTGGMSLLELDPKYVAIKEATIPALIGLATLISLRTRYPLVRTFLFNEQVIQIERVKQALREHNTEQHFNIKLRNASFMVAGSFFLSSVLNYILATTVLVSAPGTVQYTEELGKMTALSFPVIVLPSMIIMVFTMMYLSRNIQKMTHLELEDILNGG